MKQAIVTRYLCPTDTLGARVKAKCEAGEKIVPWDYSRNVEENHTFAAHMLLETLGWFERNELIGGSAFNGGFVFVQVPRGESK